MMANYPINSVSSVYVNGVAIPASPDYLQNGYVFDMNRIILIGYIFTKGTQNVLVNYNAGYVSIPAEIEQATIDLVMDMYVGKDRIGVSSKTLAGETVAFSLADMPARTKTILNNYRNVVPN